MPKRPGATASLAGAPGNLDATVPISAFELLPAGVAVLDLQGRVQWSNESLQRLTGRKPGELLGRSVADFVPPVDLPGGDPLDRRPPRRRAVRSRCAARRGTPGPTAPASTSCPTSSWSGTQPARARYGLITVHDDTVTRAVEDALRATNAELDSIVANAPLAICVTDLDGLVQLWNPQAELMFGWALEEVLGRPAPVRVHRPVVDGRPHAVGRPAVPVPRHHGGRPPRPHPRPRPADRAAARTVRRAGRRALRVHRHLRAEVDTRPSSSRASTASARSSRTSPTRSASSTPRAASCSRAARPSRCSVTRSRWWNDRNIFDVCHPDDVDRCRALLEDVAIHPGQQNTAELRLRHVDGQWEHHLDHRGEPAARPRHRRHRDDEHQRHRERAGRARCCGPRPGCSS